MCSEGKGRDQCHGVVKGHYVFKAIQRTAKAEAAVWRYFRKDAFWKLSKLRVPFL